MAWECAPNSLQLGCDCLGDIRYFDAYLCDSRGNPLTIPNAICMHEEDFGILWKHTDRRLPDAPEVRRSRRLVVSSISTVENYEYGFFWYLYQDGTIQFEVKLTGILSLGAVPKGEKPKYGALVAPQLYAPNHQHFFNMRLDFDIDGTANSVQQIDVVPEEIGPNNPFENAFYAKPLLLKKEKQARANLNLESARTWKIINPKVLNSVREPVGYKFLPGDNSFPFGSPNAWWRKRAGFRQPSRLGDAVQRGRNVRGRRLPQPKRRRRRPDQMDRTRSPNRKHRHRLLVHLRPHTHSKNRRLPRHADSLHRLHSQTKRLLLDEPCDRRAALGEEREEGMLRVSGAELGNGSRAVTACFLRIIRSPSQ